MSVHTWGESPHGEWLLEIRNEGRYMGKWFAIIFIIHWLKFSIGYYESLQKLKYLSVCGIHTNAQNIAE